MKQFMVSLFVLAFAGAIVVTQGEIKLRKIRRQYEIEISQRTEAHQRQVQEDSLEHQKLLADSGFISGGRACKAHEQEWVRRCNYDSAFARTTRERTILEISAISRDHTLPAQELLTRVAILAAPSNSSVSVNRFNKGFRVVVTFDMSVMTSGEEGARTKHSTIASLKREVKEIVSRVSKDMFDNCGQSGIESISVACTHGVQQSQFGYSFGGKTVIKTIYKCSLTSAKAKKIVDWRKIALHRVTDILSVETDEFPYLSITTTTMPSFGW